MIRFLSLYPLLPLLSPSLSRLTSCTCPCHPELLRLIDQLLRQLADDVIYCHLCSLDEAEVNLLRRQARQGKATQQQQHAQCEICVPVAARCPRPSSCATVGVAQNPVPLCFRL